MDPVIVSVTDFFVRRSADKAISDLDISKHVCANPIRLNFKGEDGKP